MPTNCYQVDVLYYLNPHLIWVEVIDQSIGNRNFVFEQIGIYGLLPVEPVLDVVEDKLKIELSDKWLPPTLASIKKALTGVQEIWFSPIYIDRRSSIFDDNIHKYGELLLKKKNKLKPLSKTLLKSGFAINDVSLFHQELSLGNLKTKLQTFECQAVIKEIENYYKDKNVLKKDWVTSVKMHTAVAHAAQELESALTEVNLRKHNSYIEQVLQNKMKDFEICKNVDEENSLGRAYKIKLKNVQLELEHKETSEINQVEANVKSTLLKKKLALMTMKKGNSHDLDDPSKNDTQQILNETKKFLELNAKDVEKMRTMEPITSYNKTNQSNDEMSYDATYKHYMAQKDNKRVKNNRGPKLEKVIENNNGLVRKENIISKAVYGPPGVYPTKLSLKVMIEGSIEQNPATCEENKEDVNLKEDIYANEDSDVNIEITNRNILINIQANDDHRQGYYIQPRKKFKDSEGNRENEADKKPNSDVPCKNNCLLNKKIKTPNSRLLQKKLMSVQNENKKKLNGSLTSCSDITNKDSSTSVEEINVKRKDKTKVVTPPESSDDEDIDDIVKKINEEYANSISSGVSKEATLQYNNSDNCNNRLKNSVNPFRNMDPNISLFIDKLVTPVMMVHTKMNKRIEPIFSIKDINFNNHINLVLKNMSIERPMMLQTISWFSILRGYSTFLISPLGSGKTMGYLPAVCRLVSDSYADSFEGVGPKSIIVCATAKSVTDVEKMAKKFLQPKHKVLACFAGVDESYTTTALLNGCDLLISTPSFLVRLLQITDFGVDLRALATLVLDDCERLGEVYMNELKYIMFNIKETLKIRINKELKVQYILASRKWCDFMEPIAKRAPYSIVCIGAFQECVLYSKIGMTVNFVEKNNKLNAVQNFLAQIDATKRVVIVCTTDEDVIMLKKSLGEYKNNIFACDSTISIQDLYNLRNAWDEYEDPLSGPILLCRDDTLIHINVTDANYLIIYSLPNLFSTFCKQFSVLNDNYPSIFKADNKTVKIKILIEESNIGQLPKMLNFMKRCTDDIPQSFNHLCEKVMVEKDMAKAEKLIPLCDNLLSLGCCPDFWTCNSRHNVLKDYDSSKDWIPTLGIITFKILYYHSAVVFSARLLSKTVNGVTYKYQQTYSTLSLKMGMYYSKESNRIPHGIPKVGDKCAVSIKQNFFVRCQVMKILNKNYAGNPSCVLIKLLDEDRLETTRDIYLYYLPEELKYTVTHVIQVRLANIQPKDKDVTFSDLARDQLKTITDQDEELYIRGRVVMTIGNCVFVDTLEACQDLTSLNKTVVKHDFKQDLLKRHAVSNPEHINVIKNLCKGKIHIDINNAVNEPEIDEPKVPTKTKKSGSWAYLESEDVSLVCFGSAFSPDLFFVQLSKFDSCVNLLLKEIQKYVDENPKQVNNYKEGDIVLALFPDDAVYERARIDCIIDDNKVKCFFVDQGDWRELSTLHLVPIKEEFITRLPFQAIECRLVGIKPAGDDWTDFCTNWFCDKCSDDSSYSRKLLYVKYFTKEEAYFTEGNRYSVVLIDTNGNEDVIINRLLINNNFAKENINEIKYLNEFRLEHPDKSKSSSDPVETDDLDKDDNGKEANLALCASHTVTESSNTSKLDSIFKQPIRSVPLVGSDYEDSDESERWNINMANDFLKIFRPISNNTGEAKVNKLPAITTNGTANEFKKVIEEKHCNNSPKTLQLRNEATELDSDDYTSSESSVTVNTPEKRNIKSLLVIEESRRPGLVWRQNKQTVTIKINLIGLQMYDVSIHGRSISFAANLYDVHYSFDIELYGAIDVKKSYHSNKGQYLLVKLIKILNKNWLTLTKDGEIRKWIIYDVDSIDASSEEEETEEYSKSTMLNVLKSICKPVESDSEDDDFIDDVN